MKKLFLGLFLILSVTVGAKNFIQYEIVQSKYPTGMFSVGNTIELSQDMTELRNSMHEETVSIACGPIKTEILSQYKQADPDISHVINCEDDPLILKYNNTMLAYDLFIAQRMDN